MDAYVEEIDVVKYLVPDNPKDRLALNKNRNYFPVYEDNLPLVYDTLKKLIVKGEASFEEISEFDAIAEKLERDTASDIERRRKYGIPDGVSVWEWCGE